ncbi:TPA: phosphopantothenoylcysteine decarboxylase, partial [Staphylococcus aureus]|nr:phosphopantothenoylcysteine decarboxylase [Staphylococcus aureus]
LGEHKTSQYLIGFAAETEDIENYAQQKLRKKNADVIISNNVGDMSIGFSSDDNELTMHFKNNEKVNIKKGKKVVLAAQILDELETRWQ